MKAFLDVLLLHREHSEGELTAAVELALETGVSSSAGVKHLLCHTGPEATIAPLENWSSFPVPDVSVYTQLHTDAEVGSSVQEESATGSDADAQGCVVHGTGGEL